MKKSAIKHIFAFVLTLALVLLMQPCNVIAEGSETISEALEDAMKSDKVYTVDTMEEMKKLAITEANATVLLKGYYAPGDGGGGLFSWKLYMRAGDNGGTIIETAADKGRLVRISDNNYCNLLWFGAKGDGATDDTEALKNAVKALPDAGGTVYIPNGVYCVSETIYLGDGDASTLKSSYMGIHLFGDGSNTVIKAVSEMDSVLYLK
ncbi:MAG TPA: glycosyl hydrolase family 28-related protein, partial [Bacillota bacterium]|nr:glycosyl hydrolase family 28-related protein [Bacillota bacterium]